MMMTLSCQSSFRGGCGRGFGEEETRQKSLARKTVAPHIDVLFLWCVFVLREEVLCCRNSPNTCEVPKRIPDERRIWIS